MSRQRPLLWTIPAFVIGVCSSAVGTCVTLSRSIDDRVAAAYEQESKKYRTLNVNITQDQNPFDVPSFFSEKEDFKAKETKGRLAEKIGFSHHVDNTTTSMYNGIILGETVNFKQGEEYDFSLTDFSGETTQLLYVAYYTGHSLFPSSTVYLFDNNYDDIPDYIRLEDNREGAGPAIDINRNKHDELEYKHISEKGAREIFDLYTAMFQEFKQREDINTRINAYIPSMVIGY